MEKMGKDGIEKTASQLFDRAVALLTDSQGVHAESAISMLAGLAGRIVLGAEGPQQVHAVMPQFLQLTSTLVARSGVDFMAAAKLELTAEHDPKRPVHELIALIEPDAVKIFEANAVPSQLMPICAVLAAVQVVNAARGGGLDAQTGAAVLFRALTVGATP